MDCRAHYFEFLEKAFDGQIIVDIKVRHEREQGGWANLITLQELE